MSSILKCRYCRATYFEESTLDIHLQCCMKNPVKLKSRSDFKQPEENNSMSYTMPKSTISI